MATEVCNKCGEKVDAGELCRFCGEIPEDLEKCGRMPPLQIRQLFMPLGYHYKLLTAVEDMREITRRDLRKTGINARGHASESDVLCGLTVREMSPQQIRQLREKMHLSQAVFAAVLNTGVSIVQKWEIGEKKPSGPALKLLNLIERKGLEGVL
jgi:putative transcriptional regulator